MFVLALDGVPYSLLKRLMADGKMPNFRRLVESGGVLQRMRSVLPPISSCAWASFMTGKGPAGHNIYGFIERDPQTMEVHVPTANDLRAETLWHRLSDAGKRVFVMNVPVTFPPKPLNGIMISGFLAPDIDRACYPPQIAAGLKQSGYIIDVDTVQARRELETFRRTLPVALEKRIDTMWRFYRRENWDFFMAHIMETDRLHHFVWAQMEDGHPVWSDFFYGIYDRVDKLIGEIVQETGNKYELLILSDHGFERLRKEVFLNKYLFDKGYLKFTGQHAPESLQDIHPQSTAYSLIPGRVYINLKGREKQGTVEPGLEYESLRSRLRADLLEMKDPADGRPIVREVLTREEAYGSHNSLGREWTVNTSDPAYLAPDLLVVNQPGYDFKGNLWRENLCEESPVTGMHTPDDAFVCSRRGITGKSDPEITDCMAAILDFFSGDADRRSKKN